MRALAPFLPSLICISLAAAILMVRGGDQEGWGWFLFLGVIVYPDIRENFIP